MKKITKIEPSDGHVSQQKLRVAAYCRVSTDTDIQLGSLETQKTHYEALINANPEWEFAGLYYDEGITGTKKEVRPALMKMIADCEEGKIQRILTKSLSRFSRNTADCLELVRKLLQIGVTIYFEKENIDTGKMESELRERVRIHFGKQQVGRQAQVRERDIQDQRRSLRLCHEGRCVPDQRRGGKVGTLYV